LHSYVDFMIIFRRFILMVLLLALFGPVNAADPENYYRNFWNPTFHGQRLNYCNFKGQCGLPVACQYCKMMGYKEANKQIIANNVGLTNFILSKGQCKGWQCNGFKLIRCVGKINHKPPQQYYYTSRRFVFPRFENYRIDWCYVNGKGCGQRAAYSFCRRMGYAAAEKFKMEECVPATKALGNQRLCFGDRNSIEGE
jgi:hypothetical protein